MCTVSVNVDEKVLRKVNPNLNSTAAICLWVQQLVDFQTQEMLMEDNETISIEEARAMTHAAIREEYAKP